MINSQDRMLSLHLIKSNHTAQSLAGRHAMAFATTGRTMYLVRQFRLLQAAGSKDEAGKIVT